MASQSIGGVAVLDSVDDECPQLADICLNIVEPGFKTRVHVVDPPVDIVEARVGRARADTESDDDGPNADEEREPILGRHEGSVPPAGIPERELRRVPGCLGSSLSAGGFGGPMNSRLRRGQNEGNRQEEVL